MSTLSRILRYVLSETPQFCCLCFTAIGEIETSYNIEDDVVTGTDIETNEVQLYEMISIVLGDKVLDSISVYNMICQKCTEIIISSYKFIQQCRLNTHQLQQTINSLLTHSERIDDAPDYKSLFIGVDTSNNNVKFYYDKHRNLNNKPLLHKRFKRIQKDSEQIYIDIELDTEYSADIHKGGMKRKKQTLPRKKLDLADILHDDPNGHKCKTCLKLFPTIFKLKQHYQRVHAPKDFKCYQCPRSFGSSLLLKQHIKQSHRDVVCSQCGKTYTNLRSLRYHERQHRQRFTCHTCGKIYKGKPALKNHIEQNLCQKMRKSNAESTLSCGYCGKKYAQKTALTVHIRLEHENGKALICDWCGKKFSSISRLKDHIVKHTKQKNFKCEQCGGKFVTKTSLLYHTRTHTGEKPYKCEYCDMSFLSASRRSEHVKRHHTQSLECDICHGKFKGNTVYNRHRKKHFDARSRLYCNPTAADLPS